MADIVLRDRNGNQVEYPGVESIKLNTVGGGTQEYVDASAIPESVEKSVTLDFSAGDMEVNPEDGQLFSGVTIEKPIYLIPGNIAEGVDVAGIIGTLVAGGNDVANIVVASGLFTPDVAQNYVLEHNLGRVPDFIFVYLHRSLMLSGYTSAMWGTSQAFCDKVATSFLNGIINYNSMAAYVFGIDDTTASLPFNSANETTVTIGTKANLLTSGTYRYLAIGGLT